MRRQPSTPRRRPRGSAVVELVVIIPFILALLAAIWDIRSFVSYRTLLARDMYVVAELIANEPDGEAPFAEVLGQFQTRLQREADGGALRAAAIVRGTERLGGAPCPDEGWCLPLVTAAWPPPADLEGLGVWGDADTSCAAPGDDTLPPPGAHFAEMQRVLPNEGGAANPDGEVVPPETWVSRRMSATEWWVVVDACFEPKPGLFFGRLTQLSVELLDASFTLRKRAAWASIHDRADCAWCEA